MLEQRTYWDERDLPEGFRPDRQAPLPASGRVLMVPPAHFEVREAINPHMRAPDGSLHRPDPAAARMQWEGLRRCYESLGWPVLQMEPDPGLPDMVFVANVALPLPACGASGEGAFVPARMRHPLRAREPVLAARFLEGLGLGMRPLPGEAVFEGQGDALWFPGRRLVIAACGPRTDREAVEALPRATEAPVVGLVLQDERFYHLDTCLCPLDAHRALYVPRAFGPGGRELLGRLFRELVEPPAEEAEELLAANAHCPDGRHVLLEERARGTTRLLEDLGYRVLPLPLSEFIKGGGSAFCMKLMLPPG